MYNKIINKVPKTQLQLTEELKTQIELLDEAIQKVVSGDFKYARIISSILRILVIETKTNKPLLFNLSQQYDFEPQVVIDSPFGIKTMSLKDHLKDLYFASGTENIKMSNEEFIKIASQQDGGSHVDSSVNPEYQFANEGMLIGGTPPKVLKLKILASHISKAGKKLLSTINSRS